MTDTVPQIEGVQPPARRGPIFLMGAMGSGTTLLRLMLDSHPSIAVPQETGFMRAYNSHRFIPFKWGSRDWAKKLGWSPAEFDAQLRVFYDTLFMRYATEHGKVRWGEKTPVHIWHIDGMARMFDDAVFVGIVRHPGGSIASNMRRWNFSMPRALSHCDRYTRELLRQAAAYPGRSVVVRYEELVLQPRAVMEELLAWLGEPWSDAVLSHHTIHVGRGGREVVEGRNRISDPLDITRIDRWRLTLDAPIRTALQNRLGRLPEFLGYDMNDPAVLEPLADRLLIGGADIAARMEAYADLGLAVRGPVPRFERIYHPRDYTLAPVEHVPRQPTQDEPGILRRAGGPIVRRLPARMRRRFGSTRLRLAAGDRERRLG